ncbi:MAG: lasso peptide biosynthesis B2 protein [Cyanobacteriota bacterium]|nr:lasso peptide biosynthesis B2 protein [Cyanobacteriota bacterium]
MLKFVRLEPRDRLLLIQAALLLSAIKLGLALFSFKSLRQRLAQFSPNSTPQVPIPVETVVWAIEVASRYIPGGARCLARALAASALLSRQGYPSQLRIGVAKDEVGQLEAHAWVELEGQAIVGRLRDGDRFVPLSDLK